MPDWTPIFDYSGYWAERPRRGPNPTLNTYQDLQIGREYNRDCVRLMLANVVIPQPEPLYRNHMVTVDLAVGGTLRSVAWPGPNVEVNQAGLAGGVNVGIHGLFVAPMPGQQALIGYAEGNGFAPMVVQVYPYLADHNPLMDVLHTNPMTTKSHGPQDIVLGSFTGAYVAIRGTIPLPGQIDLLSPTQIQETASVGITVTSGGFHTTSVAGACSLSVGAAYSVTAVGVGTVSCSSISLTATGAACTILAAGAVSATAGTTVTVAAGTTVLVSGTTISLQGTGTLEFASKGTTLNGLLNNLITALAAHTHVTPAGPSGPPLNAAALLAVQSALPTAVSTSVLLT